MSDAAVAAIARRQHGLVTLVQLRACLSAAQIRHRVDHGRLQRVFSGVFRVAGAPEFVMSNVPKGAIAYESGKWQVVDVNRLAQVWR